MDPLSAPSSTPRETDSGRHDYRPDVDGLRAISVLLVMGFHAAPRAAPGGFIGVDVFFVISGYLISGIIFSDMSSRGKFDLADFYFRRVRRLFPALAIVLAATLLAGWFFLFPRDLVRLGRQTAAAATFIANLHFWKQSGYFAPSASDIPLLHLWSLGVEEQFYIVWPPLIMLLWRRRSWIAPSIAGIAAVSFALNLAYAQHGSFSFYFPAARAWEFMLGAALAWRPNTTLFSATRPIRNLGGVLGLALIIASAFLLSADTPYPSWRALGPTIGATLVIWSGAESWIGRRFLSATLMVGLGLISYPLYLWHWPILWLVRVFRPDAGPAINIAACGVSVVAAWATYVFVEQPVRKRFPFAPKTVVAGLVAAMAAMLLIAGVFSIDGLPGRWNDPAIRSLLTYKFDTEPYRPRRCHLEPEQGPAEFPEECFAKHGSPKPVVLVWGDSAAAAIYPGLRSTNDGTFDLAQLTASGCPPFIEGYVQQASRPNCAAINDFIFKYIEKTRPSTIVLSSWPDYDIDYGKEFAGTIARLKATGAPTIVIVGPPPLWPEPLPRIILRNYFNGLRGQIPERVILQPAAFAKMAKLDAALAAAAKAAGVLYVSAFRKLCADNGSCLATIKGEPTAWDGFHLTAESSAMIARDIFSALAATPVQSNN
jgi:peptidoglycan/LPS O-acetylase OafA/YrhL